MLFVREVFGAEPDDWQVELLNAIKAGHRRISVRSGHGVGKSTALAWAICWYICTRFPQKTVATAPTTAQLFDALANETFAWLRKLPTSLQSLFNVTSDRIELIAAPEESFVSFRTSRPETPEALAGVHSANVLLIGDEASGIPEKVYEAAIGSMSGHSATTILAGNPVRTSGLFFDTHNKPAVKGSWYRIHVNCLHSKRVAADFIKQVVDQYGILSNAYRVRVLGEFPKTDDDTVMSYELVQASLNREVEAVRSKPIWGLDVARFGDDASALAKRQSNVLREPVEEWRGLDTMQTAGRVKARYDETPDFDKPCEINIDAIGIGAGVADRLRELGLPARAINVSESPALGEKFVNLRAELWWKGREWFEARDCHLANDEKLAEELVGPKYTLTTSGKTQVEAKKDMKKRGIPSPNKADAFLLTFATDATIASGAASGEGWGKALKRVIKGLV